MYRIFGILVLLLSFRADALLSKLEISMVATHLEHYIAYEHDGALDLLMYDVSKASGIEHYYNVLSFARARRSFIRKEIGCILPAASIPKLLTIRKTIHSLPLVRKQFYLYTLTTDQVISNLNDMDNKVIGVVKNALPSYKRLLGQRHIKVVEVSNFKTMLEMLNKGRLDAIIHDEASIETLLSQPQRNSLHFDASLDLLYDDIRITCHKSEATELYIDNINYAIKNNSVQELTAYIEQVKARKQ
ncbi:hypothetical protein tloyanaT_34050 [Thalassotalea loyana]|uniref:Solute-binding protein family 3/N-terminal domain-containing protein n=1 Tax=Thalassotalea loyana TaxID=280483 RepID=A0ABQ6HJM1_9GAMM|nr:transporter substrate-binding domain-containing protein [Thalassotalea loyana]GLX87152.1 hypothetical protein tloyanaT_34050 [Thalassotalea loyana]